MHIRGSRGLVFAALLLALGARAAHAAEPAPESLADRAAALLPAVVAIDTVSSTPNGKLYSMGSGFIIDPKGVIATNRHVVAGSYDITVSVPNVGKFKAAPLYISEGIDLAILRIDAGRDLPAVKFGDSNKVRIGDRVMLIGNPLGVGESLSFGVISALNRDIRETLYDDFFQTDAALNHGNSGGAMFNMDGELIAINTGLSSSPGNTGSVGIGYALPIDDAKFVIDQFMRTGHVVAGTVGVRGQKLTDDLATAFGMASARGAIITGVDAHGPAGGKLEAGDIVLKVGSVDASDPHAAARLIAGTPPGQTVEVTFLRDGAEQTTTLTVAAAVVDAKAGMSFLGHGPGQAKAFATPSNPGLGLATVDDALRDKYGLPGGQQGVVVTSVAPNSVAADRDIAPGDVILSVGDRQVRSPADVTLHLREVVDRHVAMAPLLMAGNGRLRWVALPLEADH